MSLLATRALGVTLASPLFSGLDLAIEPGDRIGLVAANGRGKSSLLRCLAGEAEPTTGNITRARGLITRHLAQEIPAELLARPLDLAVSTGLEEPRDWRTDVVLDSFAIPDDLRAFALGALSGGWQRMAMLARLAIAGPDLILLDEPTNHLDLARIGQVEDWIAGLPRDTGLVVASHDRAFLDAVTNRTLFLRPEASRLFVLPYSRARAALDEVDEADERQHRNDLRRAMQLRRQAAKLKNIGINSGSDLLVVKTKQLTERAEKIEATARPAHREYSSGDIRLDTAEARAKALLRLDDLSVTAPDGRMLYRTGRQWIVPGDRIALLGPNGAGKSRLIAAVAAACTGGQDGIVIAPSLRLGLSDQGLTGVGDAETPLDAVTRRSDVGDRNARALLAGAGIGIDAQTRPVARLSGGQRARLALLVLRLARPNFYLLDEPTNHLDIDGQEALEGELTGDASALIVSHDRAFVRAVATRFWVIRDRRLVETDDAEEFFATEIARR